MPKQKPPFETFTVIDGVRLALTIKRLDVDAWLAFRTEFRYMQARAKRTAGLQASAGADDAAYEAALETERQNDIKATQFMREQITELVTPGPGLLDEDDEPITTGAQLFDYYARNTHALSTVLATIFTEHLLNPAQKKALRLALASGSGSAIPTAKEPSGEKPEPTAESAAPSSSAESADATASASPGASSGKTGP